MSIEANVLRIGDRVALSGRLILEPGGASLCPALDIGDFMDSTDGLSIGIPVFDLDVSSLETSTSNEEGVVNAWVTVEGSWTESGMQVSRVEGWGPVGMIDRPSVSDVQHPSLLARMVEMGSNVPPLPRATNDILIQAIRSGSVIDAVRIKDHDNFDRIIVTTTEPEEVEAALRAELGPALVIIQSPWSENDLNSVTDVLGTHQGPAGIYAVGRNVNPEGFSQVTVFSSILTPALSEALSAFPEDIVDLHIWATPQQRAMA